METRSSENVRLSVKCSHEHTAWMETKIEGSLNLNWFSKLALDLMTLIWFQFEMMFLISSSEMTIVRQKNERFHGNKSTKRSQKSRLSTRKIVRTRHWFNYRKSLGYLKGRETWGKVWRFLKNRSQVNLTGKLSLTRRECIGRRNGKQMSLTLPFDWNQNLDTEIGNQ